MIIIQWNLGNPESKKRGKIRFIEIYTQERYLLESAEKLKIYLFK